MLTTFGVLFYYLVIAFLLYRLVRQNKVSLSAKEVSLAFGFKVLMACAYGYIFLRFYDGDDTWLFNAQSLDEYNKMLHQPGRFFKDLLPMSAIEHSGSLAGATGTYIRDLEHYTFHKLLAVFNLLSRGNYYINAVLFSFITFWGHYWLFCVLTKEFPGKRNALFLLIFFFPPAVFWLSGLRTDGLIFFFISLSIIHFHRWLQQGRARSMVYFIVGLAGLLIYRDALVLLLIPALLGWFLVDRMRTRPVLTFASVFGVAVLLFFASTVISSKWNLPGIVVQRQQSFLALQGNTRFDLQPLQPGAASFMKVLPQAAGNVFLRPFLWEASGMMQIMAALSTVFCWLMVLLAFMYREKVWKEAFRRPLVLLLLFFSVSLCLFIGYTVPFPGAIVRYKCIPELFMLAIPVVITRWDRVLQMVRPARPGGE